MKIGILGTSAYGIALAFSFLENTKEITMWTKLETEYEEITNTRKNTRVLDATIPDEIKITMDMKEAVLEKDIIVIAIPTEFISSMIEELKPLITNQIVLIASKGVDENGKFIRDKINSFVPDSQIAVISGPSFAIDLAACVPVGLTLASTSDTVMDLVDNALSGSRLKLRKTYDVLGVEICGAIKNVIAIASGILDGMGLPISTKAMLITESLHDMKAIIDKLGGDKKTILSFAGFGDLLLTCTSEKSRNFSFGKIIGKNQPDLLKQYMNTHTIEGLTTIYGMQKIMEEKKLEMPVISLIYEIIMQKRKPSALLDFLIEKE